MLLANFVFGRFLIPAIFATISVFLLLFPYLPIIQNLQLDFLTDIPKSVSRICFCLMAGFVTKQILNRPTRKPNIAVSKKAEAWTNVWLDFRDYFGTLWALQVSERFNATSHMYGWEERLYWHGMESLQTEEKPDTEYKISKDKMDTVLRNLFLRFVTDQWIDQRLHNTDQT
jgi:hypothetical protein